MLTFNRPQMIGRAIESAQRQTLTNWELIVVQDGDNQETERLLAGWLAEEPRLRFFRRGVVGSIAEASNYGLERARGEYVAILDDDDWWSVDDKLARQVAFLDSHRDYIAVGGGYIVVDQDGNQRGTFWKPETDEQIRSRALVANPIANSTAIFRRLHNGKPLLYDLSMDGFADWDFWLALGALGKLHNMPETLAYYALWHGSSSYGRQVTNARAGWRIINKHRRAYKGYMMAMPLSLAQLGYAYLPMPIRRISYQWLSATKKALTASRTRVANSGNS